MILDNISIKTKLFGGFIILIILAILIAFIGFLSMGTMTTKAEQMYDDKLVSLDQLLNADNSFLNIRINIYKTVFAKDERKDKFVEIDQEIRNINDKLNQYRVNASSDRETALLNEFDNNWPVFEKSLRQVIADMNAGKEEAALTGIYADNFKVPRDTAQDALDKLEMMTQEEAKGLKEEIVETYRVSSLIFLIIGACTLLFGLSFAYILTRNITIPLEKTVGMIREMGMGHLGMRLNMVRSDEIGAMAGIMDSFANYLQTSVIGIMKKIADGEPVDSVRIMDDNDEIGPALLRTTTTLSKLIDETNTMVTAAAEGQLSVRGNEKAFQGGYSSIIRGFNDTLNNILAPLNEAMVLAGKYADGQFSARFNEDILVRGDFVQFRDSMNIIGIESGKAVGLVRQEVEQLLSNMEEASASTEEITSGSHLLAQNANQVSEFSERSLEEIREILHAMEELATAVSAVAQETSAVAGLTQGTNTLSLDGARLVNLTDSGMESIRHSFEETNQVITEINSQMEEIGTIVEVIGGISDQTNLLALNAAIEAARAGDAGLGFAVVADEVKSLAEESRLSTERITGLISALQKKSENVTVSMNRSLSDVQTGERTVQEMKSIFDRIAESISTASQRIDDVAATTQEQAASVEEITANVHELEDLSIRTAKEAVSASAATEEASAALDQIATVVEDANASINRIAGSMHRFKI
jgi:methyl-accepting chemotaxis protein